MARPVSTRHQLDVSLITVAAVFLLAGQFADDAQILQQLDRRVRRGKTGVERLPGQFDGKARHHGQRFEQAVTRRAGLRRSQQSTAVGSDQTPPALRAPPLPHCTERHAVLSLQALLAIRRLL